MNNLRQVYVNEISKIRQEAIQKLSFATSFKIYASFSVVFKTVNAIRLLRNAQKITSRFQKISEGKVTDN